jgi:hypothetical protein
MRQTLCAAIAVLALGLVGLTIDAPAQQGPAQIKLTEKQIEGCIAAQRDMSAVVGKMQAAATADKAAIKKYEVELEAVTRKHGFKNFIEYEAVAASISMVLAAIDPQTKTFTDPQNAIKNAIKKEIEDVTADKAMAENEKKQLLQELKEALQTAEPIQFPGNVELVRKYYDQIDAALG